MEWRSDLDRYTYSATWTCPVMRPLSSWPAGPKENKPARVESISRGAANAIRSTRTEGGCDSHLNRGSHPLGFCFSKAAVFPRFATNFAYFLFVLGDSIRFAYALIRRRVDPSRFLLATPDVADCTIYAERVMPACLARRSISSIWFSRAVTLTRTVFVLLKSVVTRNATAFCLSGSLTKSSIFDGLGIFSPSSTIPAI